MMCRPKGGRSQPRYHNIKRIAEEKYFRFLEERKEELKLSQVQIYIMILNQMCETTEAYINAIKKKL